MTKGRLGVGLSGGNGMISHLGDYGSCSLIWNAMSEVGARCLLKRGPASVSSDGVEQALAASELQSRSIPRYTRRPFSCPADEDVVDGDVYLRGEDVSARTAAVRMHNAPA